MADRSQPHPPRAARDLSGDTFQGLLRVATGATIWGSMALFARWSGGSPIVTVFWRVAFASAALLLFVLWRHELSGLLRLSRRTLLGLVVIGALLAVSWVSLFVALGWTSVATAVLLNYTGPVLVAAFTPLATHVPFDKRIVPPLLLALAGTAVIVGPQAFTPTGPMSMWGAVLALSAAFTYAIIMLMSKRLLAEVPAGLVAFSQQAVAAVILLPAVFFLPGPVGIRGWTSVTVLGVVHTAIAVLVFFSGLRLVRADHAAVLSYIEPVAAVIFAGIFLSEPLTWFTVVGGAAVVAGGVLVGRLAIVPGPESPVPPPKNHGPSGEASP